MNIAIIGSGHMAHGIGTRIVAGNHPLTIYDRTPEKAQELAKTLGGDTQAEALSEALKGDVIVFALPYAANLELVGKYSEQLADKIVVDISNPVNFQTFELIPPPGTSGVEEIAKLLPVGAKIVKAFNTTFAGTLVAGQVDGKKLDVFIAGDDEDAKKTIKQLVEDGGLRGIDAGPLSRARHLEGFQLIQMASQQTPGTNWMSAIKILP